MGPRFNGVEDRLDRLVRPALICQLQWGHALMAWKTCGFGDWGKIGCGASMGPRFNGVEDPEVRLKWKLAARASMGPRFNGVEDPDRLATRTRPRTRLQWGHALMAWKTHILAMLDDQPLQSFNGATL